MRSYCIRVDPSSMTGILMRKGKFGHRHTEYHVMKETDLSDMSKAKEGQKLLAIPRSYNGTGKDSSLEL